MPVRFFARSQRTVWCGSKFASDAAQERSHRAGWLVECRVTQQTAALSLQTSLRWPSQAMSSDGTRCNTRKGQPHVKRGVARKGDRDLHRASSHSPHARRQPGTQPDDGQPFWPGRRQLADPPTGVSEAPPPSRRCALPGPASARIAPGAVESAEPPVHFAFHHAMSRSNTVVVNRSGSEAARSCHAGRPSAQRPQHASIVIHACKDPAEVRQSQHGQRAPAKANWTPTPLLLTEADANQSAATCGHGEVLVSRV